MTNHASTAPGPGTTETPPVSPVRVPRTPPARALPATPNTGDAEDPVGDPEPEPGHQPDDIPARDFPGRDRLVPARVSPRDRPATRGWRGRITAATHGRVRMAPSRAELRHRDLLTAVRRPLVGPRTVVVVNPKGGAGKTPAALLLAASLGAHRGSALAWDNNETRGTLGLRALAEPGAAATVWDLLADLDHFQTAKARIGDLAAYTRAQGQARFDVLASDADPARMAQVDAPEFARLHDVLTRFYGVLVIDTGNNVRARNWQAALDVADAVVVTTTHQTDTAISADWVLDHLRHTGRAHLADTAVTVLSAATPTVDRRHQDRLVEHFGNRTRAVVQIPYDPAIATGERLDLTDLRPATQHAWLTAAAAVLNGLSPRSEATNNA